LIELSAAEARRLLLHRQGLGAAPLPSAGAAPPLDTISVLVRSH
jgi:uncharacterized protein YcaQ